MGGIEPSHGLPGSCFGRKRKFRFRRISGHEEFMKHGAFGFRSIGALQSEYWWASGVKCTQRVNDLIS